MNVLIPIEITDDMFTSSTVSEPAASETAWVSGTTYAVGDYVIRTETHREYVRLVAGAGTTAPEDDTTNWLDAGPTLKWAAFDTEVSTQTVDSMTLTLVLEPGFFNAIRFYGLDGGDIEVTVKDQSGGSEIYSYEGELAEPPIDWYDWAFGTIRPLTKLGLSGITPYPDAEVTITITGAADVKVGMIAIGDLRSLIGEEATFGGTIQGASADPVTFSYIKTEFDGTTRIVRRRSATDMRARVFMPREFADYALSIFQQVLDVPACWVATTESGYAGLDVFGLASGSMSYDSFNHAVLSINVKGLV